MLISFTSSHLVLVRCYDAYLAIAHQLWLLSKSELKLRDHLETPNRLLCLTVSSRPECPILSVRWRGMSAISSHNGASCSPLGADRMRVMVLSLLFSTCHPIYINSRFCLCRFNNTRLCFGQVFVGGWMFAPGRAWNKVIIGIICEYISTDLNI